MKETNMEHYRGEIEKALKANKGGFATTNGKICVCEELADVLGCEECDFKPPHCITDRMKWLMSEYKPEPVLTAREKGFAECMDDGWIARDKDEYLHWYEEMPRKGEDWWEYCCDESGCATLKEYCFPFITWEDEKPWSVEKLRKLKVQEWK
ncbi:MAG: hypothetical protein IKW21_01320 [Lachnospiraceae bacterium]|nr:hypothetical protein [Lachnospiraceae bacterium]